MLRISLPFTRARSDPVHFCSAIRINFDPATKANSFCVGSLSYRITSALPRVNASDPHQFWFGFIARVFFIQTRFNHNCSLFWFFPFGSFYPERTKQKAIIITNGIQRHKRDASVEKWSWVLIMSLLSSFAAVWLTLTLGFNRLVWLCFQEKEETYFGCRRSFHQNCSNTPLTLICACVCRWSGTV